VSGDFHLTCHPRQWLFLSLKFVATDNIKQGHKSKKVSISSEEAFFEGYEFKNFSSIYSEGSVSVSFMNFNYLNFQWKLLSLFQPFKWRGKNFSKLKCKVLMIL
jgi:hypothetical protein